MMTLCIRYRFNPHRIADVREYFETEQRVIERSGGRIVGYFLPTDFAEPTDEAMGLIDIPSMTAYEIPAASDLPPIVVGRGRGAVGRRYQSLA